MENPAQNLSAFQYSKASRALSVQTWCLFSTDQVILTLKHTLTHTDTDTPPLITVCWEQCTWHLRIYGTLLFCFQPEVAKSNSIRKSMFYSLDTDNCEDTATYLWARCFQSLPKQMCLEISQCMLSCQCNIPNQLTQSVSNNDYVCHA